MHGDMDGVEDGCKVYDVPSKSHFVWWHVYDRASFKDQIKSRKCKIKSPKRIVWLDMGPRGVSKGRRCVFRTE